MSDTPGKPGASAQREHDRRTANRATKLSDRWGQPIGKVVAALTDDPQNTNSWGKGAEGERLVGAFLEKQLHATQCVILHDRAIPGSRANIDHLVVGPAGIAVVDAKNISGKVRVVKRGIGTSRRGELHVDGRDRTKMIDGVLRQIAQVEAVMQQMSPPLSVPVTGSMCWWNGEGLPLIGGVELNGIAVLGKRETVKFVARGGPFTTNQLQGVAQYLAARFPAA